MMDGHEINIAYLQARLDPQVVFIIDVPCAGMAYHVAIARLHEQRSLPECLRKRREAHRDEEILAVLHHAFGIKILPQRSEEHTSELQSLAYIVCRLLLEKKKSI